MDVRGRGPLTGAADSRPVRLLAYVEMPERNYVHAVTVWGLMISRHKSASGSALA
jgi:hypothetical protein